MHRQADNIYELTKKYNEGLIARADYAFALMRLPVDALSVLLFRKIYREMKKDGPEGEKECQALRTTANSYVKQLEEDMEMMYFIDSGEAANRLIWLRMREMHERFDPRYFKSFWFGMVFQFMPITEETPVKVMSWFLHRVQTFIPPATIKEMVRSINLMFRQAYVIVTPQFLKMPEHVRGIIINRNK